MRFIFFLLLFPHIVSTADAQTTKNSIRGVVIDYNGAVISDANVSITKSDSIAETTLSIVLQVKTDNLGNFLFKNLSPGKYKLTVISPLFGSESEKQISIPQGKSGNVDVKIEIGSGCNRISDGLGNVTDADKALVAKLAFENAFITNSGLLEKEQKDSVIVSTRNIKPEWLKDVNSLKINLMSQNKIQNLADSTKDFPYISFSRFDVKGSCVAIEVANIWAVGNKSKTVYLSGGGKVYEFRKESGKWNRKLIWEWIS